MLYNYIKEHYKPNELFFLSDISYQGSGEALRQQMKYLSDQGRIRRYLNGVYYIPEYIWGIEAVPSVNQYVEKKYLVDEDGNSIGYFGGLAAVNAARLTTQMTATKMIVYSNRATTAMKTLEVNGIMVILKKPVCRITNENVRILQLLTMLMDAENYSELSGEELKDTVRAYVKREKIDGRTVMDYADAFPSRIYMSLYKGGLLQYVG